MGEPAVLSRDSVLTDFQERLTEVSERLLVLVHGIHLPLSGLLPELVTSVTTTELRSTRRSTELVLVLMAVLTTTLRPRWTQMSRTLPHWVVSLTTVSLTRTSLSSRVVLWAQERDKLLSESLSCSQLPHGIPIRSISSSSIPPPRSVTVSTRPLPRRTNSSVHLPPSKSHEQDNDPSKNYSAAL